MCLQAFAQTPMLSLINWRKKNGSEWSRLKHSVLFGESGRVSILLFRNYPTICFTTSGNVEGFFRLLPPRSRMSEKSFLWVIYAHNKRPFMGTDGGEGSETQNRKNKSERWLAGVNTKLRSGKPIFPLGLTLIYRWLSHLMCSSLLQKKRSFRSNNCLLTQLTMTAVPAVDFPRRRSSLVDCRDRFWWKNWQAKSRVTLLLITIVKIYGIILIAGGITVKM